jgi:alpha-1,3-glucan synthase
MMMRGHVAAWLALLAASTTALIFTPEEVGYNLNENTTATEPADYWGEWTGHQYHPSPTNWRFPFYTLFLDRFVNGDPTNDNINGTQFEHDLNSNQMRHGGDIIGLIDTLDYLHGMDVKVCNDVFPPSTPLS